MKRIIALFALSLFGLERAGNPRIFGNYLFEGTRDYTLVIKMSFRNGKAKESKSHLLGTYPSSVRLFHVHDFMNSIPRVGVLIYPF